MIEARTKTLRFDQLEILNEIEDYVAEGLRRIVVQAPTGYGKTMLSAGLLHAYLERGKRVLFVVPAINLVNQSVEMFQAQGMHDIGVMQAYHEMTNWDMPLQVASVQTLSRRNIPKSDIVMIDEVHTWHRFYEKWLLNPDWKDVPFIGLSATPWTKGLGAWFEKLVIASTTQECIDAGLLSPFRVYAPAHPDLSDVRTLAGDYHEGDLERAMVSGSLVADIVETWRRLADNRPTFCFCVNRVHAKTVQKQFLEAGISAGYQDAFTRDEDRALLRQRFHSGEIQVVCSVGTLIVGVDWDVRCLIWARPTKSEILFVQGTGRGLRTATGKPDCLILDHSDNHHRLGFVTDIIHDTLSDGKKPIKGKADPMRLPKECPQCSFLRPPRVLTCPACGFKPEAKSSVVVEAGELHPLRQRKKKGQKDLFDEPSTYAGLLWHAVKKGYKPGWAKHKYFEMFGKWPDMTVRPQEPDVALVKWIRSRQIAWAKSKHNSRNKPSEVSPEGNQA